MKKKLTAADMHDPQVIAETPWFSMRKVGIDVAPGERRAARAAGRDRLAGATR